MRKRNWLVAVALTGILAMVAAACGGAEETGGGGGGGGEEKPTVKIAFIGALSGDYKFLVIDGYNAAKLAFDQANAAGDLPVTVELVQFDSQGSGDVATSLVDQITGDDAFVGVIGPAFSGESGAVGDDLNAAGIPFITQSATDDALALNGWTTWFRALGNNSDMGAPAADYIAKVLNVTKACAASDGSPYGLGLKDVAVAEFGTLGVDVADLGEVEPGGSDYSALVAKIGDAGCEGIFYGGYSPEAGKIRKQMTDAGLEGVTMVGGDGIKDESMMTGAGAAANGTISSCTCADISASTDADDQQFISDFTAAYGAAPTIYGPEGWDIAQMYIAAFRAGNTDRASIVSFIKGVSGFHGLTKDYTFQEDGELADEARVLFFYEVQNEEWVVLGPSDQVVPA